MLKSKGAIYLLIPLNILIWGFFIYRFYTAYTEGGVIVENERSQALKLDDLKDSLDYKLSLNYKDPFLREQQKSNYHTLGMPKVNSNSEKAKAIRMPTVTVPKAVTDIRYFGLVKNNSTGVSTALLSINGKSHLVKKGDIIEGISIKNISNEAVELKEGKNSMTISKN